MNAISRPTDPWLATAIRRIEADYQRSADTHLIPLPLPALAEQTGGHYMDQFTYAERATDWRGNNNIAESMFQQMARERHPVPAWIVVGAGTGGTSATIGRYVRFRCHDTQVCVADPEGSVFSAYHRTGDTTLTAAGSRIEGIGRPREWPRPWRAPWSRE